MKHEIKHQADIDGISYVNLTEAHIKDVIDFYFDVFLRGKMYCDINPSAIDSYSIEPLSVLHSKLEFEW